jgi:hypothetical protein
VRGCSRATPRTPSNACLRGANGFPHCGKCGAVESVLQSRLRML